MYFTNYSLRYIEFTIIQKLFQKIFGVNLSHNFMFSFISKLFNQSSTQEDPIPQKLDDENFTPNDVSTPEEEDSIAEDFDLTQIPENFESLFKEEVENIWQDPEKFKNFPTEKKIYVLSFIKKKSA